MARDFDRKTFDNITIVLFFATVALPLIGTTLKWDVAQIQEKRRLATLPDLRQTQIEKLPGQIEAYCDDHFGFRNGLIKAHNWMRYTYCRKVPGHVVAGENGWMYLSRRIISD